MGSDKCAIPVKTIRDACEWFGVLIETPAGLKLFARREPGNQKATGDMFVIEGSGIEIPKVITGKNASVDAIKRRLDEFVGLTNLDFDAADYGSGFKGRPSFRDLGAFLFQPQNIVANPDILFYKADTYEHREKLRTIFPYMLNAVTADLLAKQHELAQLRKELRRKQRELANIKEISVRWLAEIRSRAAEARELGLIKEPISAADTKDRLIELLSSIVSETSLDIKVTGETVSEAVDELLQLQREESDRSQFVSGLRKRYAEMAALRESSKEYVGALQIQKDRLRISEWLAKTHDVGHNCPICGNTIEKTTEQLKQLLNSLREIETDAGEFDAIPAAFDREFERVRAELKEATEKLQGIRIRRQSLEKTSEEARQRQYESLHVSRFVGNLEEALKMYSRIGTDNELTSEVQELQDRVAKLEGDVSEGNIKSRIRRAIDTINLFAAKLLPYLDCERPEDPISLSIDNLTVAVSGQERDDYLWEIGSGSNWLSYHIAVSLALQKFFLTIRQSPVPSFLIYDQPSQVYFPKRLAAREDDEADPKFRDEDVEAVQKVFNVFSQVVEDSKGRLQVIVLDHASESVWGHIANIHVVEEWRGERKLIPSEWLS